MAVATTKRAGSRVLIDGLPGEVLRRDGTDLLIDWRVGDPVKLGARASYSPAQIRTEWIPATSDRLTERVG